MNAIPSTLVSMFGPYKKHLELAMAVELAKQTQ
jgi:hypothetical protein